MGIIKILTGKTLKKIITGKSGDLPEFWCDASRLGEPIKVTLQHIDKAFYNPAEGTLIGSDEMYQMEYSCGDLTHVEKPPWSISGTLFTEGDVRKERLSQMERFLNDQFNQHFPEGTCEVTRTTEHLLVGYD